jgi:hypothetical protein
VSAVYDRLMVDDEWSVKDDRGFTWWPHRHRQRVFSGEPFEDAGVVGCRVFVETDLLRCEDAAPKATVRETLTSLARFPPMSAFVLSEGARAIRLFSSVFVHDELAPFLVPRLAVAAALQATYAELGSAELSRLTGLTSAESAHPVSGDRSHPDEMLRLAGERIAPAGDGPSKYADGHELRSVAEELIGRGATALAFPLGVNARFPFRSGTTSLLQVRAGERHPELGSGVFLRLFLPTAAVSMVEGLAGVAMRLNRRERNEPTFGSACLGSWCLEESEPETDLPVRAAPPRLAYVLFFPNALYLENVLANLAVDMGMRALWASHALSHGAHFFSTKESETEFMQ